MTKFIDLAGTIIAVDAIVAIYPPEGRQEGVIRLMDSKSVGLSEEQWRKLKELLADNCTSL